MDGELAPISFDFGAPAVAVRSFTHAGTEYMTGAAFPYAQLGLKRYEVHGLWLAHLVRFETPKPSTSPKPTKQKPAVAR